MAAEKIKKVRGARATPAQSTAFVSLLEKEKGLAEGKFLAQHGKDEAKKKWIEIAVELNSIPGTDKCADQWQISKISNKFKTLRRERAPTGNRPLITANLTDIEQRVVDLVGWNYMEGTIGCPDSMDAEITPVSSSTDLSIAKGKGEKILASTTNDITGIEEDCVIINNSEIFSTSGLNRKQLSTALPTSVATKQQKNTFPSQPPNKRVKKADEKNEFLKIAKTQAEALMVLANAQKEQSTANLLIAESLTKKSDSLISQKKIEDALIEIKKISLPLTPSS